MLVFSALTGDWHPQHCDADWAASSPFGERIAHGMLILSLAVGSCRSTPSACSRCAACRRRLQATACDLGESMLREPASSTDLRPIDERSGLVDFAWASATSDGALVCRATRCSAVARRGGCRGRAGGGRGGDGLAGADLRGRRSGRVRPGAAVILKDRRILVTGVLDRHSIAFATAARPRSAAPR